MRGVHWLLQYDYVDDYLERRAPFREEHLRMAREAHERGALVMAGALPDEPYGALLVFTGDDSTAAHDFADNDPYVLNEVVTGWRVRPWNVVVGGS
jgi:uncharacterized protein YciI